MSTSAGAGYPRHVIPDAVPRKRARGRRAQAPPCALAEIPARRVAAADEAAMFYGLPSREYGFAGATFHVKHERAAEHCRAVEQRLREAARRV